jgi:hypothetical protein
VRAFVCVCLWVGARGALARACACMCSLAYLEFKAHATYCIVVCGLWLHHILSTSGLSHKRHDFRKNVIEHKVRVLIFSTIFFSNISHSKKNSARYCKKCENIFV